MHPLGGWVLVPDVTRGVAYQPIAYSSNSKIPPALYVIKRLNKPNTTDKILNSTVFSNSHERNQKSARPMGAKSQILEGVTFGMSPEIQIFAWGQHQLQGWHS